MFKVRCHRAWDTKTLCCNLIYQMISEEAVILAKQTIYSRVDGYLGFT